MRNFTGRHLLTLSLFYLLLGAPVFANGNETNSKRQSEEPTKKLVNMEKLNGKVKSIRYVLAGFGDDQNNTTYQYDKNQNLIGRLIYKGKYLYTQEEFKDGLIVEKKILHELGYPVERLTYRYDNTKNLVEIKKFDTYKELIHHEKIKYDKRGNKTEHTINDAPSKYSYNFDAKKNMIEIVEFNSDNTVKQMDVFWYDDHNNKTTWGRYNSQGINIYKVKYTYDHNHRLVEQRNFDSSNELTYIKSYKYNSNNQITQLAEFDGNSELQFKIDYDFREDGIPTKKVEFFADGTRTEYMYDMYGNIINMIFYSLEGEAQYREDYNYTYDDYNNWVRKTKVCNKTETIVVRAVEYY